MQLFKCTNSILDKEFQKEIHKLAIIWGATNYQAKQLPISIDEIAPRHARTLAGYLHQLAIEAYKRRAKRVRGILVTEGPASDGKPKMSGGLLGGVCVFPIKGQRDYNCVLELKNGERFQVGFKGTKEPESDFILQQFATQPSAFRLLQ